MALIAQLINYRLSPRHVDEQHWDDLLTECDGLSEHLSDHSDHFSQPGPHENALSVPQIPLKYFQSITNNFSSDRLIGSGGFADVYLGITQRSGRQIAVKKLKKSVLFNALGVQREEKDQLRFNYEVEELSKLKHINIIDILAYSNDSAGNACLIYPYMSEGNLEDHLLLRLPKLITNG